MWFTGISILTYNPTVFNVNGRLKSWWQKHGYFLMLSPNWPPWKYIRDLSYYQQYIGLHRYHIIPYITGYINQFSKPGDTLLALSGRGNATFFLVLISRVAKTQLESYMLLNFEVGLLRLEQLYPMIGWKTSRVHYTCMIKMVICYKSMYILHMTWWSNIIRVIMMREM